MNKQKLVLVVISLFFAIVNYIRISTLFKRECFRFLRVYNQTIISPVVNAVVFFLIFTVAFSGRANTFSQVPYSIIVASGLIAMSCLQAAYYNTQSTISIARIIGFIKDYTITPLTTLEIFLAIAAAGVARAMLVGIITFFTLLFFVEFPIHSMFMPVLYLLCGTVLFAILGIIIGFISADFDKAQAYTSYIITPLTMLSGTFYSASALPMPWRNLVLYNPVYHIISGFRAGFVGESSSFLTLFVLIVVLVLLSFVGMFYLKRGLKH